MSALIEASDGFVRDDGTPLAEMREQLEDETANYERQASNAEKAHMRKSTYAYSATATVARRTSGLAPGPYRLRVRAYVNGVSHYAQHERYVDVIP